MIQKYRILAPKRFNFKTILEVRIFKNSVTSRDFTFTFSAKFHDVLLSLKYDILLLKSPKHPIFIGWIPSPLLRPITISFSLFRLAIYGLILPVVLDGFLQMISFVFFPKSILTSLQLL